MRIVGKPKYLSAGRAAYIARLLLLALPLAVVGCNEPAAQPPAMIEPSLTADQAISMIQLRCVRAEPIRANGQCLLEYLDDGKLRKENFSVKLWVNPPNDIYMQGDVAFDAKGIVLGSNAEQYWLWIRPKEVSRYWWGRWSQAQGPGRLMLSPRAMLEALGIVDMTEGHWVLSAEGDSDILSAIDEDGTLLKRVVISRLGYRISRIEYYDSGVLAAYAELGDYTTVNDDFSLPTAIKLVTLNSGQVQNSATITLRSVKPTEFSERQMEVLFTRPEPKGFEHVYQIIEGTAVEVVQD